MIDTVHPQLPTRKATPAGSLSGYGSQSENRDTRNKSGARPEPCEHFRPSIAGILGIFMQRTSDSGH